MKKYLLVFIIITGTNLFASAPDTLWTRTYGGSDWNWGSSIQQTSDGGFIIAGGTGAGNPDVYLIKTNSSGDTLWTKTFGGINDEGCSVQQTQDGGFIIAGYTGTYGAGSYDAYLIRTDSSGNTLWTKTFGGTNQDFGRSIQQTEDGGFILVGTTSSFGAGYRNVYLIKTDSSGDTIWTKTFGGTGDCGGYSVQQTKDSGFIIAGYTGTFGTDSADVYLIKTDSSGDTLWTRTYGGTKEDESYSVQQTNDNGFIITGWTNSFGAGGRDIYLIRTNFSGDTLWTKTFGSTGEDYGHSVQQTQDNGFIITGDIFSSGTDGGVYLIRTDSSGDTLWTKTFGGTNDAWGESVQQTEDGGFIVAGAIWSFGAGHNDYDVYLIRLGKEVGVEETSNIKTQNAKIEIWQNPFIKSTIIKYQIPVRTRVILSVYDISGSCVKTLINGEKPAGSYNITLTSKELKTGVYFVRLTAGTFKETKKLILMK